MQKTLKRILRLHHGKVEGLHMPGGKGVRLDTALYTGYVIPHNYDSMIAKLIVHDKTRLEAINKMKSALSEFVIDGIDTNIDFLLEILNNNDFVDGNYDTSFVEGL